MGCSKSSMQACELCTRCELSCCRANYSQYKVEERLLNPSWSLRPASITTPIISISIFGRRRATYTRTPPFLAGLAIWPMTPASSEAAIEGFIHLSELGVACPGVDSLASREDTQEHLGSAPFADIMWHWSGGTDPSVTSHTSPIGQRSAEDRNFSKRRLTRNPSWSGTSNGSVHGGQSISWRGHATPVTSPQASTHGGSHFQLFYGPSNSRGFDACEIGSSVLLPLPHGDMRLDGSKHSSAHGSDVWNWGLGRKDDSPVTSLGSSANCSISGGKECLLSLPITKPRAQSVHGGQFFAPVREEEPRAHSAHGGGAFHVKPGGSSARWCVHEWLLRRLGMRMLKVESRQNSQKSP